MVPISHSFIIYFKKIKKNKKQKQNTSVEQNKNTRILITIHII